MFARTLSRAGLMIALAGAALAGCTEDASPDTGATSRLSATEPEARRGHRRGPGRDRPDRAELEARREARQAELLSRFDADHDGALSDDERAVMHRARVGELRLELQALRPPHDRGGPPPDDDGPPPDDLPPE